MKTKTSVGILATLVGFAVVAGFILKTQSQVSPPSTAAERISRSLFFGHRLVPLGTPPTEEDSQLLLVLLNVAAASNYEAGLGDLEVFINTYTNSPWLPSLDAALGSHYLRIGRFTLALEHLERAWDATKGYSAGDGKWVADFALAHWTRLLASLGRYETLVAVVEENRGRVLDRGPLSQKWVRTREAVVAMRQYPAISYQCGTFALNSVARQLGLAYDPRRLLGIPSPATGFSLSSLAEYSAQLGLGLVPVARMEGAEIPVPAVVHWRQDHYGAIVSRQGDLFKVVDPTFGYPRYMSAETINAEASGVFMIPANRIGAGHRILTPAETSLVYGRGNPNFMGDSDDQGCVTCPCPAGPGGWGNSPSSGPNSPGPGPNGSRPDRPGRDSHGDSDSNMPKKCFVGCSGMPVWRVSEPYINLWLEDEPLSYQTALGARFSFHLSYKQREEYPLVGGGFQQPLSSSVGVSWSCPWLSKVYSFYDQYREVTLNYGHGGDGLYKFGSSLVADNYYNTLKLAVVTNGLGNASSFELLYPTGARDVYGFGPTNLSGQANHFYLSAIISAEGHTTTFQNEAYDPESLNIRLKYVVDADGKTNTIYYATSGFSTNLITQVSDPYGRSTYLQYDADGMLTNITDSAGMSSSMGYNELGWPTNLATPYGTTTFAHSILEANNWERHLTITEPNNSKQLYRFYQFPEFEVGQYDSSQVPTNTPIGTLDNDAPSGWLWGRFSYHWGRLQYANLSTGDVDSLTAGDYLKARMRRWLGATVHNEGKTMDTLSIQREPSPDGTTLGQVTWYDYPNKGAYGSADKGDHILPGVVARVLPDGSTWYEWTRRNTWGQPTNVVETYTQPNGTIGLRTNHFVYDANGVDLILHIGPSGEQVVSNYFGNAYHQVDASYDALGQETKYLYNGNRQLIKTIRPTGLTTTNIYFSGGGSLNRLDKTIDLEIARTNSYTYAGDLVDSHTD
ncbi:MAG TPA: cysteine peptidase family C39 domain-containing protein, partial [Verrucomicrobiae bacterium]|nr:cysteine peptidase family C39 domain-containing protein [Verrucomicrobiae bacterium]